MVVNPMARFIVYFDLSISLGRLLYWTQNGDVKSIKRSFLNGSNIHTVIQSRNGDVRAPRGLSIDHSERALYWCDSELHKIELVG